MTWPPQVFGCGWEWMTATHRLGFFCSWGRQCDLKQKALLRHRQSTWIHTENRFSLKATSQLCVFACLVARCSQSIQVYNIHCPQMHSEFHLERWTGSCNFYIHSHRSMDLTSLVLRKLGAPDLILKAFLLHYQYKWRYVSFEEQVVEQAMG